jgi:2-haloacid dehalogenase
VTVVGTASYDAVLFDLLTALIDSWTLWNDVAGGEAPGRAWRAAYLKRTYQCGAYRPYETLVAEAAAEVGLAASLSDRLAERYDELEPWPEVPAVLGALKRRMPLGVVTNCSDALAAKAVAVTGISFDVVVTAESAGFYKPDSRPYQQALDRLALPASRCLFVAGSPYDLFGTSKVGLLTFWHDRVGLTSPPDAPKPLAHERSLRPLLALVGVNESPELARSARRHDSEPPMC